MFHSGHVFGMTFLNYLILMAYEIFWQFLLTFDYVIKF